MKSKFSIGDKVKFTKKAQKNIEEATDDVFEITDSVKMGDNSIYKLINSKWYKEDCFEYYKKNNMKITKETKIKDLIPKGYEPGEVFDWNESPTEPNIVIALNSSAKTFKDYEKTYYKKYFSEEAVSKFNIKAEDLNMVNKLGLLWHIINDKEGGLQDLAIVIYRLQVGAAPEIGEFKMDNVCEIVWDLLPQSFVESFKEE